MKAKTMNALYILTMCIVLSPSIQAQKTVDILINSERVKAQVQNGRITTIDKSLSSDILNAIRNPVVRDAEYYRELNEILAGKYGKAYAEMIKRELTNGGSKTDKKFAHTAVVSVKDVSVSFIKSTARLTGESSDNLVKLTDKLKTKNINYIMIEGRKASNEISDYILTTNRVNTCKDYLVFKGIDIAKIKTKILLANEFSGANNVKISVY